MPRHSVSMFEGVWPAHRIARAMRLRPVLAIIVVASLWPSALAFAQTAPAKDHATTAAISHLAADIKAYLTAPLHAGHEQWLGFGAAAASIAVAYQYDQHVREHFGFTPLSPSATKANYGSGDAAPALLAVGGLWVFSALRHDGTSRAEMGSMLEAAAFSSAAAQVLKRIAGRERPYAAGDPTLWRAGGQSFPSGHVTAAFAVGTVLAESGSDHLRWLHRIAGYGVGALTAYARIEHDAHWTSDTVAGAALGVATARFVMKRQRDGGDRATLQLLPLAQGLEIAYAVALR